MALFEVQNLTQLADLANNIVAPLARVLVYLMMLTQGLTLVFVSILLLIVGIVLFRMKKLQGVNELIARFVGLMIALIFGIIDLALLVMVCYFVGWVNFGPNPSPWDSFYLTVIANAWFQWALFAGQLLWISAIAYSMRTVVKKSWLVGHFRSLLSAVTSRTGNESEMSSGSQSGTGSTFTTDGATFNDD